AFPCRSEGGIEEPEDLQAREEREKEGEKETNERREGEKETNERREGEKEEEASTEGGKQEKEECEAESGEDYADSSDGKCVYVCVCDCVGEREREREAQLQNISLLHVRPIQLPKPIFLSDLQYFFAAWW